MRYPYAWALGVTYALPLRRRRWIRRWRFVDPFAILAPQLLFAFGGGALAGSDRGAQSFSE